ncbi:hypothetical protein L210DRAFT_3541101 [Boletus edulis BED1]|uniref:Uncharacterized protein n=1 Tax=Boletus edulis BED1 TaxID=1328754 RepID=A0AAD4BU89_BOLED|nr:hypothetical protein L210DRAFT_3541101 [Boletus edulis BED1]
MWHYHREYLPPKPIDAFVECTSVTNIFPLRENIRNIWFRRQRTHGFPLAQFLLQAERLSLSAKGRKRGAYLSTLSGLPMPLTISALFVDIVRSSCPFKGRSMASRSRKSSTAQVARSPPAIAITKLNCWPCQTDRSLAMTGWAGIETFESQGG